MPSEGGEGPCSLLTIERGAALHASTCTTPPCPPPKALAAQPLRSWLGARERVLWARVVLPTPTHLFTTTRPSYDRDAKTQGSAALHASPYTLSSCSSYVCALLPSCSPLHSGGVCVCVCVCLLPSCSPLHRGGGGSREAGVVGGWHAWLVEDAGSGQAGRLLHRAAEPVVNGACPEGRLCEQVP